VNSLLQLDKTDGNDVDIGIDSNLVFEDVTSAGNITALVTGPNIQAANTVSQIGTPVTNWISTTNPLALITGRDQETDAELRARARATFAGAGLATIDAIIRTILQVNGVSYTDVIESTFTFPVVGQPVGSINTVVVGGSNIDVAQGLLESRAAGVETFGAITESAVDINGLSRDVNFDRPTLIPNDGLGIYVEVRFDLFDDEIFPTPESVGIQAIKDAIVEYGNNLGNGIDVDPGRFFGTIYNSVAGIAGLTVEMSAVDAGSVSPSVISIAANEISVFVDNA
ncbi:unnamed protein product, partial [marine sediment metagenome]